MYANVGSRQGSLAVRLLILGVALCAMLMLSSADEAAAKRIVGSAKADKLVGTAKADKINARGGKDRVDARRGNDKVKGGGGRDRLKAGPGKDKLAGGGGADRLNSVDGAADRRVNGGKGRDVCTVDKADVSVVRNCEQLEVKGSDGGGGSGGSGGSGGGSGPGGGALPVTGTSGLECAQTLPLCTFTITGTGADQPVGTVTGGGDVTTAGGAAVATSGEDWTAAGLYGCTGPGYLRVTIGEESVDVPVTCMTNGA